MPSPLLTWTKQTLVPQPIRAQSAHLLCAALRIRTTLPARSVILAVPDRSAPRTVYGTTHTIFYHHHPSSACWPRAAGQHPARPRQVTDRTPRAPPHSASRSARGARCWPDLAARTFQRDGVARNSLTRPGDPRPGQHPLRSCPRRQDQGL
ncbi:hypothetical protein C2E23DRAFT_539855 [Lenzites betulinus]|nr:hypothetical protein C2E23DRAFT_539855 [Lenzites betulinus]